MENDPSSRIEGDSVYGGSMTPEEFMDAEFRVNRELPAYGNIEVPQIEVTKQGRDILLDPFNSAVVAYSLEGTMHDHVLMPNGEMLFYRLSDIYNTLAEAMLENDFPLLLHYEDPLPDVKQALEDFIRGDEAMADIIDRILMEEEDGE